MDQRASKLPGRRQVLKGAALTAGALAGAYVKPDFRSLGIPAVRAAVSGAPVHPAPPQGHGRGHGSSQGQAPGKGKGKGKGK